MQIIRIFKREIRLLFRKIADIRSNIVFCRESDMPSLLYTIELRQPLLPSSSLAEKRYNLRYAADRISRFVIMPGEVFSFWHVVGSPDNLKTSRCIREGKVNYERGGGLCQAASILYHLSLLGGIKVIERYNHSIDLYGDGPRANPIGLDATVSYGYKDLRIYNSTSSILRFQLIVKDDEIIAELQSNVPLVRHELEIERIHRDNFMEAEVRYVKTGEVLSHDIYMKYDCHEWR